MSEYLDEEEQLARMKSWWDENGTFLIVAVVAAVLGVVGWNWYSGYSEESAYDATRAWQAFNEADGEERTQLLAQIESEHGGSGVHVLALFAEAKDAIDAGEFDVARGLYERAVDVSDHDILTDLARIRLARVQQELDLSDAALATLARVSNSGYRSLALEVTGDIHAAQGDVAAAHAAYGSAKEAMVPGDSRPLLNMKFENTQPFGGEFVQMTDALSEALREAAETLAEEPQTTEAPVDAEGAQSDAETVQDTSDEASPEPAQEGSNEADPEGADG